MTTANEPEPAPDPVRSEAPFGVFDGVALVVWSLAAQLLVGVPLAVAGFEFGSDLPTLLVLVVVELVTLGGVIAWLAGRGRLSWRLLGRDRPRWTRHALIGLGVGAVGFFIVTVTVTVANELFGPFEAPRQGLLETTTAGGAATVLSIVVAVVLAPVVEETIFRGVLFQALRDRLGVGWGVALSSVAFALVHLEISQLVFQGALVLLGAWFALSLHRSRSLVVPIVGHAVFNGITVTLALLATG